MAKVIDWQGVWNHLVSHFFKEPFAAGFFHEFDKCFCSHHPLWELSQKSRYRGGTHFVGKFDLATCESVGKPVDGIIEVLG